ncbi:MAG: dimethyl sulfoxide reductase anchor subunit [Anaerolineales bacterium]|nr:dimethyl sulfoxide reductase anchor subunit [Anaerolineales bacterium]
MLRPYAYRRFKMTYAFTFDASACSGCKACQEACKDKNNLPVGVMWRRVIEVSGGGWVQAGKAWTNNVFAYNLSIACNHCVHPKCAGVCPTDAYVHRADGIVYIDPSKCMGCGYCSWACPYNAPRYNPELGQMSKCNFCFDNIDAGLPPSCVAACPMRVLNFVEVDDIQSSIVNGQWSELWELPASEHPFPLPNNSRTEPHLMVKPHVAMGNNLEKKISNYEEIRPKHQKSEMPLVAFTLLVQMAVGAFWAAQWMFTLLWNLVEFDAWLLRLVPYLIIGACLGLGGFFSFAHLGAKRNAWRAPFHLKKSWLSREILLFGLFGAGWLAGFVLPETKWVTSLLGIGLIYSMAKVYRLHVMPAWNTWRTTVGFFITSALLGHVLMWGVLAYETQFTGINISSAILAGITVVFLVAELGLLLSAKESAPRAVNKLRGGLIVAAIIGAVITASQFTLWNTVTVFALVLIEEIIGRWLFYRALQDRAF